MIELTVHLKQTHMTPSTMSVTLKTLRLPFSGPPKKENKVSVPICSLL